MLATYLIHRRSSVGRYTFSNIVFIGLVLTCTFSSREDTMDILNSSNMFDVMPSSPIRGFTSELANFLAYTGEKGQHRLELEEVEIISNGILTGIIGTSAVVKGTRQLAVVSVAIDFARLFKLIFDKDLIKGTDTEEPCVITLAWFKHHRDSYLQSLRSSICWNLSLHRGASLARTGTHVNNALNKGIDPSPDVDEIFNRYRRGIDNLGKNCKDYSEKEYCKLHSMLAVLLECTSIDHSKIGMHINSLQFISTLKNRLCQVKEGHAPIHQFDPGRILKVFKKSFDEKSFEYIIDSLKL